MELSTEVQHGAGREAVDGKGEVKGTLPAGGRGARTFTEDVSLRPEPLTDRTGTYLWIVGMSGHRLVLPVPA